MILSKVRDPRLVTVRRGGTLTDDDHQLLALWAATCAQHVLHLFEAQRPTDPRPREAIEAVRAWTRGQVRMWDSRSAGGHAMAAARDLAGAARHAAYAAGQAGAVAHVAAHDLGAAAYAIRAARAAAPEGESEAAGRAECRWQREQLPEAVRELVLGRPACAHRDLLVGLRRLSGTSHRRRLALLLVVQAGCPSGASSVVSTSVIATVGRSLVARCRQEGGRGYLSSGSAAARTWDGCW